MTKALAFGGGPNIALKVPPHQYDATVHFYRNLVGLRLIKSHPQLEEFEFGANHLWVDRVVGLSQAEVWLELVTDDVAKAEKHFDAAEVVRCDEIEPLSAGFDAFWIANPASIIHLVCKCDEST